MTPAAAVARSRPDPRKAAHKLVARMHPDRIRRRCTFGVSKVSPRHRRLWLAIGSTCYGRHEAMHTRVRIYGWTGRAWRQHGSVTGPLGPSQWIEAAALSGASAPEFAIEGCGAGDTNCLSVVSKHGGRWHAVPFEYGYGRSLEVNGVPAGHWSNRGERLRPGSRTDGSRTL